MLNSTEHKISTAHEKIKRWKIWIYLAFKLSYVVLILQINAKMPTDIDNELNWVFCVHSKLTIFFRHNLIMGWLYLSDKCRSMSITWRCAVPIYMYEQQLVKWATVSHTFRSVHSSHMALHFSKKMRTWASDLYTSLLEPRLLDNDA